MHDKLQRIKKTAKPRSPKAIAILLQQKDKQIEFLSQLVIVMGVFNAAATLPQAYTLWSSRDASGLSLLSWSYYFVFSVVLFFFGVLQRQRPLIATYSLSSIVYLAILVGLILFR